MSTHVIMAQSFEPRALTARNTESDAEAFASGFSWGAGEYGGDDAQAWPTSDDGLVELCLDLRDKHGTDAQKASILEEFLTWLRLEGHPDIADRLKTAWEDSAALQE